MSTLVLPRRSRALEIMGLLGWIGLSFLPTLCAIGMGPDGWYDALKKPSFNPPNWIFGPVWTTLYLMMGIAAWRVWRNGGFAAQRGPLGLFLVQLALNALWTPLFFRMHMLGVALLELIVLWLAIAATIRAFRRIDVPAAWLLAPYIAWVSFAGFLNGTLWYLNR